MSQRHKAEKKERHRHGHAFGPNNDQRKAHGHAAKEGRRARRRLDHMIILDEIEFIGDDDGVREDLDLASSRASESGRSGSQEEEHEQESTHHEDPDR